MMPIILCGIFLFYLFAGLYKLALLFGLCAVIPALYFLVIYKLDRRFCQQLTPEDREKYYGTLMNVNTQVKANTSKSTQNKKEPYKSGSIIYCDQSS